MKKNTTYIITILTILLLIFTINSCKAKNDKSDKKKTKMQSTDSVETIFAVNTTMAIKGEINDYIELNGDVKTKTEVDVYPDTMGKLKYIKVKIGQYVKKDQVVAYVDPSKPGMNFALSPVKSPIYGTITDIPVQIGATITQQVSIVKVGKLDEIEIITYISEKFISKIKIGLNAIIRVEAFPDIRFRATISDVSPVIDPQTRMMEMKLKLTDDKTLLKPGMFAEVKIITKKKQNIVKIPAECLIKRYGAYYVFIVQESIPEEIDKKSFEDNILKDLTSDQDKNLIKNIYIINKKIKKYLQKEDINELDKAKVLDILKSIKYNYHNVEKRKVISGIQIDNKVEIVQGLDPDEEVVLRGQTLLEDKSEVRVIKKLQPLTREDIIE
ncbi:MAG: efflux RND transporter periplasmic adaptor subunit [Spirochaetes bacterium]|nr:efflux RND transporter periplasmic adaptor subunit [Spirochaetota bacterium]